MEVFEIKNLGEYYDFMLKVIQYLAVAFENFRNKGIKIYELDPTRFLSVTQLVINDDNINDIDIVRYVISGRKRYQKWNMSC